MTYEKAWSLLKQTLDKGIKDDKALVDKATLLQVKLVMQSLEKSHAKDY